MKDKICKNCNWYLPPNATGSRKEQDLAEYAKKQELLPCGFCVRYPPTAGLQAGSTRTGWVIVGHNDYCGEFAEKTQ